MRFGFVQWEFPGRIGPDPGRYVVRRYAGDDVRQVVVIGGFDAPRRRLRGPRPRRADPGPTSVEINRATVIDASSLGELEAADAWLERAAGEDAERITGEALVLLNRAVAGQRIASADPFLADADPAHALVCRVGYGTGEQVADGDWESARELPLPKPPAGRSLILSPQERLAALLSGRDAALQLAIALDAGLAELEVWRGQADIAERLEELDGWREAVARAARAALEGGLDAAHSADVSTALGRLEAALRARTATSAD